MTDAEKSLRKVLEEIAGRNNICNYKVNIKGFTSGGANFTSAIFFATISSPYTDDLNLFAKVAAIGEKIRKKSYMDSMFKTEQLFYTKLVNTWDGFQKKYSVQGEDRFIFPKFYGGSPIRGEETIVLENLVTRGYETHNRLTSVDWQYASEAIKVLAKFHAFSFVFERECPDEYVKICNELVFKFGDQDKDENVWEKMIGNSIQVLNEDHRGRVMKYFKSQSDMKSFLKYYEPIGKPVLIHGDYRPSNLLNKRQGDSLQIVPVDYQTIRAGSPVSDLIYFIFVGSDQKFRAKYYHQLIEHYYEQLFLALAKFNIKADEVYSRETFNSELKEMLPFAVMLGVLVLPVVTVEAENAPRMDGDADFNNFVLTPNELFAKRFTELIEDCIQYKII
ncbi:uncharacterized protein LOC113515789 [Galleria mellonella]|uniref:Uncharacterized protein LOC113515789 n=1 Tax=Galleria mellonella TaxID=7137 RepID=A0A6J1WTP9_GALME|nr:uncharacterized protein LOC113515789 [Galleria mellonella]